MLKLQYQPKYLKIMSTKRLSSLNVFCLEYIAVQFSLVGGPSCGKVLSSLNAINTGIMCRPSHLICICVD